MSSISVILSSVIVVSDSGSRFRNPNLYRRSAMAARATARPLRRHIESAQAGGGATAALHHVQGHCWWKPSGIPRSAVGWRSVFV